MPVTAFGVGLLHHLQKPGDSGIPVFILLDGTGLGGADF